MEPDIGPEDCPTVDGIPRLGLGTYRNTDPDQCTESVRTALELGYRHVDTAAMYDNEVAVGEGIRQAAVDREEVFLATKLWYTDLGRGDVREAARASLDRLGVDAVDLLYVHWPTETYVPDETLPAFAELYDDGLIDRIGVSNFSPELLEEAIDVCDAPIAANQVEMHPLLPQRELREACDRHDVELVAYTPIARGAVFDVPAIQDVASKHGVSEAQVSLTWLREKGVTAIPKATGRDHIADNWASLALELDDEDVAAIDGVDRRRREVDPSFGPWN
ncbi:aldo/keto reductase [Natrialbaceae archaeon AArc-T1-2]|uniref:aldo/keto reductase n=1 Tax=Natrialbaceae archaeon AArc-T1-2 TaxID=3053904 RepID=UPI00255AC7CC|nr:aldo/keto reductase [Natrialbaceae archaeon AArc-T1-2]WIV66915.1 aldo/keto reductase [Natrialbaceae archaeon AArc-T1-2]